MQKKHFRLYRHIPSPTRPSPRTDLPVALIRRRRFACDDGQITGTIRPVSRLRRGAYRDRHGRWARDAMDAGVAPRRSAVPRTVKSCGPDIPTLISTLEKLTLLRGMEATSGEPVVTCLRAFYFCTRSCGCIGAPGFPCALSWRVVLIARADRVARRRMHILSTWRRNKHTCHAWT
jgi:hypothetical protein